MRKQLRAAALTALKTFGAFRLVEDSAWRRQRLLILCYHGIALEDEDRWRPFLYISKQQLERRLNILREGKFNVLPLGEALQHLRQNDLPPRSVALTFDDGTYDFYARAYPLLKRFGFPVTVYLTTYYSELQLPVFSLICSYMLWKARLLNLSVDLSEFGAARPVVTEREENRDAAVEQIVHWAERQDFNGKQKDEVATKIATRLGIDYESLRAKRILHLMNSKEVKELAAAGVDFQLHTHRHRMPLQEDLFRREIRDNRAHIAGAAGGTQQHFCYPSGAYRPEYIDWLAKEEIISATTCDTGFATADTNRLLLPRFVDTGGRTDLEFESWVNGIGHFLSRRRRARLAYVPD
jgi:peptidoglycan/xylan/chitin deacetylase (PgdA/CDA1 family)